MNEIKLTYEEEEQVIKSLTGNDTRLIEFIPYILQDLFELGSTPKYTLELLERNFRSFDKNWTVLELCCGKGAVILSIIEKYGCKGIGIDLFWPFILEAAATARKRHLNKYIGFEIMDIETAINVLHGFDLVIFGFDTDKLGSENESLNSVGKCCREKGFLLVESSHESIEEFEKIIVNGGMGIIDKIIHPHEEMKRINSMNTNKIQKRIYELEEIYPEHKQLFEDYLNAQVEECIELENNFTTGTYLLQTK